MENVCQIMWPQLYVQGLKDVSIKSKQTTFFVSFPLKDYNLFKQGPLHERANAVAKVILGDDMIFDFDMLIYKVPFEIWIKIANDSTMILYSLCCLGSAHKY